LGISNDQLYANFVKNDKETIKDLSKQHEAAAITEAKRAANSFAQSHPQQAMFQTSPDLPKLSFSATSKKNDKSNLVLDQTEIADQYSILGFENDEKPSERFVLADEKDKDAVTLVQPELDTSMPKWPTYESPVSQKA
jgi:hypothetical protein